MKTIVPNRYAALTLIDVMIVIAALAFMALFFLVIFPRSRVSSSANGITCVNNLKQVGLAFRLYAGDNGGRFPMNISKNNQPLVHEETPVYKYFDLTQDELGTPKVVLCPSDAKRIRTASFKSFGDSNISYFIGLDSNETFTNSMLSGDRNVSTGIRPNNGILRLTAKQKVEFTKEIHNGKGNIALGDGSVQQVSSARLRSEIIANSPFATNRIKLP